MVTAYNAWGYVFITLVCGTLGAPAVKDAVKVEISEGDAVGVYKLHIQQNEGTKTFRLHRPAALSNVLDQNIKVLKLKGGVITEWIPSKEQLDKANDVHVSHSDDNVQAVLRLTKKENSSVFSGVVGGSSIFHDENHNHYLVEHQTPRTDFIDLGRNITYSRSPKSFVAAEDDGVVELVIILDKQFCDVFSHNEQRILEYLTVYLWDVNMRYKTLKNVKVSFRLNGILMISSFQDQPFIEEARAGDGRAEFGRILDRYTYWLYSKKNQLPPFDMAPVITNTKLEWGGGLAYMNAACWVDDNNKKVLSAAVWNDEGNWGSLTVGAHEMGHNLGAPHDDDSCTGPGYIMGGGNDELRWLFSVCSDTTITNFVKSNAAGCLRTLSGTPVLDASFSSTPPSMTDQCIRHLGVGGAFAGDGTSCKSMKCYKPSPGGFLIYTIAPVDNTPCAYTEDFGGNCFRGSCRPKGQIFKNVGTGLCMQDSEPFNFKGYYVMVDCLSESYATPLNRLFVGGGNHGTTLSSPFNLESESGVKCAWTGSNEGDVVVTDRCGDNPFHGWDLEDAGNGEFLIKHKLSGRCVEGGDSAGSYVYTYADCNSGNAKKRWVRYG